MKRNRETRKREPVGDPIKDYFPAIISRDLFFRVQTRLKKKKKQGGGRMGQVKNLFTKIIWCPYCGGVMRYNFAHDHGSLLCDTGVRKVCDKHGKPKCTRRRISYDETVKTILSNCRDLRPEDVLPSQDDQRKRVESLRARIEGTQAEIADLDRQVSNLTDQIPKTDRPEIREKYQAKMNELLDRQKELEAQQQDDERQLHEAEIGEKRFHAWQRDLKALMKAIADDDANAVETRQKLRAHLAKIIDKIEVFTDGHRKLYDEAAHEAAEEKVMKELGVTKITGEVYTDPRVREARDGEYIADRLFGHLERKEPKLVRSKADRKVLDGFLKQATAHRMSRQGRFLRVYFATGKVYDFAPQGSLAAPRRLVDDKGRKVYVLDRTMDEQLYQELVDLLKEQNTGKAEKAVC